MPKKKSFWAELFSWLKDLLGALIFILLISTFLIQPIRVQGTSMCDTLQDGEVMLVTKPEYLFGDPAFGDVVICRYPGRGGTSFVKRVMGLPGDTIEIRNNVVYRNGEAVEEPYLTAERNDNGFDMPLFQLVEDEYFVRIDHEMTKQHYISFVAAVSSDRIQMIKLYPEGNAEGRFKINGVKRIVFYCNRDGLYVINVVKGIDSRELSYDNVEERRQLERAAELLFG